MIDLCDIIGDGIFYIYCESRYRNQLQICGVVAVAASITISAGQWQNNSTTRTILLIRRLKERRIMDCMRKIQCDVGSFVEHQVGWNRAAVYKHHWLCPDLPLFRPSKIKMDG
ncbi:hypothetical protein AAC387_Pa08g1924 [Persea americana]